MNIKSELNRQPEPNAVPESVSPEDCLRPYLFSPFHDSWVAAGVMDRPSESKLSLGEVLHEKNVSAYRPVRKVAGVVPRDLTDDILAEAEQRRVDNTVFPEDQGLQRWMETFPAVRLAEPEAVERIRFFSMIDPEQPSTETAFLPSCHPLVEEVKCSLLRGMHREQEISIQDKVAQRKRAAAIGIFRQPDFADIRYLLHPSETQILGFQKIDFSTLPIDSLLSPKGGLQEIIFENPFDGFVLSRGENGIGISSCNARVKQAMGEVASIEEPRERIIEFLSKLSQSKFAVVKVSMRPKTDSSLNIDSLLDALGQERRAVYIKSTRTAGGVMILRVEGDGEGGLLVKSDSPEYQETMDFMEEQRSRRLQEAETRLTRLRSMKGPSVIIEAEEKLIRSHQQPVSARALLNQVMTTLEQPILETEIPTERVNGKKGEFRIICQRPSPREELEVVAQYTKVSEKEIAANISLGGHGEHVQDFIAEIFKSRCPEMSEGDILLRSRAATAELLEKARTFANRYAGLLAQDGGPRLDDFALDICPTWDGERGAVEFYFLEFQKGYAFKALSDLDPEAAEKVSAGKERLAQSKGQLDRGLLEGIDMPDLSRFILPR